MTIHITSSPARYMRYHTCGDWQWLGSGLHITVVELPDERHMHLIAVHELAEAAACRAHGVSEQAVDDWDLSFKGEGEPGADRSAPYFAEHTFADVVERALAEQMGVDWEEYELALSEAWR